VTKLEDGIIVSNGPCWSPDGGTFYFVDSFRRYIWAYKYDTMSGDLLSRRMFADFEGHLRGFPDGATVDSHAVHGLGGRGLPEPRFRG
jgi:sugar lactone lactonase YvrE